MWYRGYGIPKNQLDVDNFVQRSNGILSLGKAQSRDIESLEHWVEGTGFIAREETAYLTQQRDLMSLAPVADNAVVQLEAWVEDQLIHFYGESLGVSYSNLPFQG